MMIVYHLSQLFDIHRFVSRLPICLSQPFSRLKVGCKIFFHRIYPCRILYEGPQLLFSKINISFDIGCMEEGCGGPKRISSVRASQKQPNNLKKKCGG